MERLFNQDIAGFYEKFYKEKGIVIESGRMVKGFEGNGQVLNQKKKKKFINLIIKYFKTSFKFGAINFIVSLIIHLFTFYFKWADLRSDMS